MADLVPRGPDAPTYGPTPRVEPNAPPNARMSPEMPLAAAGGGPEVSKAFGASQDLAEAGQKLAIQEQERNYQIQETLAAGKAGKLMNTLLAKGLSAKGENAFGVRDDINKQFTDGMESIGKDLPPAVQVRFQRHVNRYAQHLDGSMAMHEMQETNRVDNESQDQLTQSEIDGARLDAYRWNQPEDENTPNPLDSRARTIIGSTRQWAARNGVPSKVADAHASKLVAHMYGNAIDSLLDNGQELDASNAFKKYSNAGLLDGDPKLKDQLAKHVEDGSIRGAAEKGVNDAWDWAIHSRKGNSEKPEYEPTFSTEKAAVDAVKTMTDGQDQRVQDEAVKRAVAKYHQEKESLKEGQDADFQNAADAIRKAIDGQLKGGEVGGTPSLLRPADAMSSELWNRLSEGAKEHLERYFTRLTMPEKDKTDERTLTRFYGLNQDDYTQMSPTDMFKYRTGFTDGGVGYGGLSDADYRGALTRWNAARKKEDSAQFKFMQADEDRVFKMMQDAGIGGITGHDTMKTIEGNDTKRKAWESFRKDAMDALAARFQDKKKNADPKERDEVVRDLIIDKTVHQKQSGFANWLLDNIPGYRGKWDAMGGSIDITPDERKRATALVERVGKEVTDAKLQMLARAARGGASGRLLAKLAGE